MSNGTKITISFEVPGDPTVAKAAILAALEHLESSFERTDVWSQEQLEIANAILRSEGRKGTSAEKIAEEKQEYDYVGTLRSMELAEYLRMDPVARRDVVVRYFRSKSS